MSKTLQANSQALSGPFSEKDLPDFQAAKLHAEGHWMPCLTQFQYQLVSAIINRTARFGCREAHIPKSYLFSGHNQNENTGYAGQNPIIEVHPDTFKKAKRELADLGILKFSGRYNDHYTLDYSVTISDLIKHESVIKRILKNNPHGQLSTIEGIHRWAITVESRYLSRSDRRELLESNMLTLSRSGKTSYSRTLVKPQAAANEQRPPSGKQEKTCRKNSGKTTRDDSCSSNSQPKRNSQRGRVARGSGREPLKIRVFSGGLLRPYTTTHVFSSDKSSENKRAMGNLKLVKPDTSALLNEINARVDAKRSRVDEKRRVRRTLADECALFEKAWQRGQRARTSDLPPTRIVGRDRALLKTQIIKPSRGTKLDVEEFALWVTENWDAIGAQYFAKSKSYPENPAIRWLVACFETYVIAFDQREYLDETGSLNKTKLMAKAAQADKAEQVVAETAKQAKERIAALEAELREANTRLQAARKAGRLEPTEFEREMETIISGINSKPIDPSKFDDESMWVDNENKEPRKMRKLRKHRK